jgi:PAS domain S-box-containing protein
MKSGKQLVLALFVAAAGLLAVSIVSIYRAGLVAVDSRRDVARQTAAIDHLDGLISALKDAETSERGFLITGEEPYLGPLQQALVRYRTEVQALWKAAADGLVSSNDVKIIQGLAEQKLAELDRTIRQRRETGLTPRLEAQTDSGKLLMDETSATVRQVITEKEHSLQQAVQNADDDLLRAHTIFHWAAVLNLGFLLWACWRIYLEMDRREAAVQETTRQKELVSTTLASIGDAVVVTDARGCITFANAAAESLTGWPAAEAVGRSLPEVFHIVDEDTHAPAESPVDQVLRLGSVIGVTNHTLLVARSGKEFPIDDSAAPIHLPDGKLCGVVLVFRDFTERRRMEDALRKSGEELERLVAERTARLQEMVNELQHVSYAITHDMRAPLRAMNAFAELLLTEPGAVRSAESQDHCRRICTAAGRLDRLIRDSLNYTKAALAELPLERIELDPLVRGLIATYPNLRPENADIQIEGTLPVVLGNESLLTQCFSNLLGNAVKFVAPGVRPRVNLRAEGAQGRARIWVQDNGIGIPKAVQYRLFGMFQKLDRDYEGTGIGLAIVRKVVERMGGTVGVVSDSGQGSNFWVELKQPD